MPTPTPGIVRSWGRDRSFLPQGSLDPGVGMLVPAPGNARAEGRDARSYPRDRSCRGSGCSFLPLGMLVPRVGMLVPTPRNARAEGRDARSHPWDRSCRGSGETHRLPGYEKRAYARARSLSGKRNQRRNQVVGSVAWAAASFVGGGPLHSSNSPGSPVSARPAARGSRVTAGSTAGSRSRRRGASRAGPRAVSRGERSASGPPDRASRPCW